MPEPTPADHNNRRLFSRLFYLSLLLMLAVFWSSGHSTGYNSDEMDMNAYGKANIAYYQSGGKDTGFMHPTLNDGSEMARTLPYYGSVYEYLLIGINRVTGLEHTRYEFAVRHLVTQFFAVLCLLFTGLIARRLSSDRAALLTIWLLFLTPMFFGHALFNTKDIPFAAAYIACLYFLIRVLDEWPRSGIGVYTGLCLALLLALGTRIGGLLLPACWLPLFLLRFRKTLRTPGTSWKSLRRPLLLLGGSFALCLVLLVLTWPFLLRNPIGHLVQALTAARQFPQRIPLPFEGELIDSLTLPSRYLLQVMMLTIPLVILIAFAVSLVLLLINRLDWMKPAVWLILLAAVVPVAYAMATGMPLYSGWRHFLFVYPCMILLITYVLELLMRRIRRPALRWLPAAAMAAGILPAALWGFRNHPYEYTYYNELAGNFKEAYYNYETDYWQISVREAADWLMQHELRTNGRDSVTIGTNAYSFLCHYLKKNYPGVPVRVASISYRTRAQQEWRYAILNTLFISPQKLVRYYPPKGSIHEVTIDGLPITAIVRDTVRLDLQAVEAMNKGEYLKLDSLMTLYLASPIGQDNESVWSLAAMAKATTNDPAQGIAYAQKILQLDDGDFLGNLAMGLSLMQVQRAPQSITYLERAEAISESDLGKLLLMKAYEQTGNKGKAEVLRKKLAKQ